MLRRFLTALALITGLAATGAPAHAAIAEAVSAQAQSGDKASKPGQSQVCECVFQRGLDPMKKTAQRGSTSRCEPAIIYIPTVYFGADRAFE